MLKLNYLWADVEGTGALVCRLKNTGKAKTAKYWIATGSLRI
jgi:hypothetical protein